MKTHKWLIGVVSFVAILFLLYACFPYGPSHRVQIEARKLSGQIRDWVLLGKPDAFGFTKEYGRCYVEKTNFVVQGTNYLGVLAWESSSLRSNGRLIGTEQHEIFWCDEKGCTRVKWR